VVNRVIDEPLAQLLRENFIEVLWAPGYTEEAWRCSR
jgi:AICAR transformylase/IMP cyclohydrolase PurH